MFSYSQLTQRGHARAPGRIRTGTTTAYTQRNDRATVQCLPVLFVHFGSQIFLLTFHDVKIQYQTLFFFLFSRVSKIDSRYSGALKNPLNQEKLDLVEFLLHKINFGNLKKIGY